MSATPRFSTKTSHIERTAAEPRDEALHKVIIGHGEEVNPIIRLLRLSVSSGQQIKFLPGQWLDVHLPGLPKPGGFTITSTPSKPYLELAIQRSPENPAAEWLWRPLPDILGAEVQVRVGGSFVWPPRDLDMKQIGRVVFIAGGVGVNPLMSMISTIAEGTDVPWEINFLYSVRRQGKVNGRVLFEERLQSIFAHWNVKGKLVWYQTGERGVENGELENDGSKKTTLKTGRIKEIDIMEALGTVKERERTLCYICGVPTMTDAFVEVANKAEGMSTNRVLFERWW